MTPTSCRKNWASVNSGCACQETASIVLGPGNGKLLFPFSTSDSVKTRTPLNSPGSPAQCPAVSTTFGAMKVPEQRNAGCPPTSITTITTAGWAFPSTFPLVMNEERSPPLSPIDPVPQPTSNAETRSTRTNARDVMVPPGLELRAGGVSAAFQRESNRKDRDQPSRARWEGTTLSPRREDRRVAQVAGAASPAGRPGDGPPAKRF